MESHAARRRRSDNIAQSSGPVLCTVITLSRSVSMHAGLESPNHFESCSSHVKTKH